MAASTVMGIDPASHTGKKDLRGKPRLLQSGLPRLAKRVASRRQLDAASFHVPGFQLDSKIAEISETSSILLLYELWTHPRVKKQGSAGRDGPVRPGTSALIQFFE
jgi:hypothetical protein